MRFFSVVVTALSVNIAYAAPLNAQQQGLPGAFVTTGPEWGLREESGLGKLFWNPVGACQNLAGSPFDESISSFGPEPKVTCVVYDKYNCSGTHEPEDKLTIFHPGYALLKNFGWDNRISSFNCSWIP